MSILMPKKVKHRKWQRGKNKGTESRGTELNFGSYGLKGGKLWIRIFPDRPVTKKGDEVPLGGGKGYVDHYVFSARPGRVIFELDGVKEELAKEALEKAGDKLPLKTKFVKKEA
jgi:large subunit ribosomal protein L16